MAFAGGRTGKDWGIVWHNFWTVSVLVRSSMGLPKRAKEIETSSPASALSSGGARYEVAELLNRPDKVTY